MQGWVGWSESEIDTLANTSKVTVRLQCAKTANITTKGTWAYEIYVNGSCVADASWYGTVGADWVDVATVSAVVPHNADGSKTARIYACIWGPSGTTMSGKSSEGTAYAALSVIPRASIIGATDANIGSSSVIAVTKMASAYTHSIAYQFGGLSGYIGADGGLAEDEVKMDAVSLSLAVPEAWYAQIPSAKSGVCTLTCRTYSGDTQIGEAKTATFVVSASEALCAPAVSGQVTDTNTEAAALTGDSSRLIRYISTAKLEITAAAKNSASITGKAIAGQTLTGDTLTIPAVETASFVFAAVDSRGYSTSVTVTAPMIEYIKLTNNAAAVRSDATSGKVELKLSGMFFNGNFGASDNALVAKYRKKTKGGSYDEYAELTPTVSGNSYNLTTILTGLTYTSEWVIEVVVSDRLMSRTVEIPVGKGIPIANWGEDFWQFNVGLKLADEAGSVTVSRTLMERLVNIVGAKDVWISVSAVSPASLFGGTWEQIKDCFILAAGDTYAAGSTGGEATHKLTTAEMPSHKHSYYEFPGYDANNGYRIGGSSIWTYWYWYDANTGSAGGDQPHNNMPPYLAVYVWRRVS